MKSKKPKETKTIRFDPDVLKKINRAGRMDELILKCRRAADKLFLEIIKEDSDALENKKELRIENT